MKIYWNMFTETGWHPPFWASIACFVAYTFLLAIIGLCDAPIGTKILGYSAAIVLVVFAHIVGGQIAMEDGERVK